MLCLSVAVLRSVTELMEVQYCASSRRQFNVLVSHQIQSTYMQSASALNDMQKVKMKTITFILSQRHFVQMYRSSKAYFQTCCGETSISSVCLSEHSFQCVPYWHLPFNSTLQGNIVTCGIYSGATQARPAIPTILSWEMCLNPDPVILRPKGSFRTLPCSSHLEQRLQNGCAPHQDGECCPPRHHRPSKNCLRGNCSVCPIEV